ncbi:MAG: hypothetical protein ABIC95_06365 [archaeon]
MARKRRNKKEGDIAINTIFVIFVAAISILLLIALFAGKLPTFAKTIYCKTFFRIQSSTYFPEAIRVDTDFCASEGRMGSHYIFKQEDVLREFSDGQQVFRHQGSGVDGYLSAPLTVPNSEILDATAEVVVLESIGLGDPVTLSFNVGDRTIPPRSILAFPVNEPIRVNFATFLETAMAACTGPECEFDLNFWYGSTNPAYGIRYAVQNLEITYERCFVKEEIIAGMLACYEKASYGERRTSLICDELTLDPSCEESYPITDATVATTLWENGLCEVLTNGDVCLGDNVDFELDEVTKRTNVLIEYIGDTRHIRVS